MDKLDLVAMNIGYCFILMGAAIIGSAIFLIAAYLMNRAQHAMVDSFGGWETFKKYSKLANENEK